MDFFSFDFNPTIWWGLGYLLFGVLCTLTFLRKNQILDWQFLLGFFIISLAMRLPALLFNRELDQDESQMLTQAITLEQYPVVWKSVDVTTGGPFNSYFIIPFNWLGFSFNYHLSHSLCFLICCATSFFIYQSTGIFFKKQTARLAILPLFTFLTFTQNFDFIHYSSELLAIFVLAIMGLIYAKVYTQKQVSNSMLFWLGLLVAAVPFCKLQAIPIAFIIVVFVFIEIFKHQKAVFFKKTAWFILGGCVMIVPFVGFLWKNDAIENMITFYIIGNLSRSSENTFLGNVKGFFSFIFEITDFVYFWVATAFLGLLCVFRDKAKTIEDNHLPIFIIILLLAITFSILRTGSHYGHYFYFALMPLVWLNALFIQKLSLKWVYVSLFTFAAFALEDVKAFVQHQPFNVFVSSKSENRAMPHSNVAKIVLRYATPGEYLTVWGYMCGYYVETRMPQGVNENHSLKCIFGSKAQPLYRKQYLEDIQRTQAPVFIDPTGKNCLWFNDRIKFGYETFPELRAFIDKNYTQTDFIDDTRIFVRKDRMVSSKAQSTN